VSESGQTFEVAKTTIHPNFHFPALEHDIAIVELIANGELIKR